MKIIILTCIGITTFLAFHTSAEESKNFEINLTGKNGAPFQMTFIYCPSGETFLDPKIKNRTNLKEFYISDFKITTSQFVALMGPDAIKGLKDYLVKMNKDGHFDSLKESASLSSNFPAIGIIPEDAVKFCFALQKQYSDLKINQKDTYEGLVFKIPSHEQWVYAARGSKTPENSQNNHFAFWFSEEELLNENKNIHNDLKEIWAKTFPTETFKFDQTQIVKLFRSKFDNNEQSKLTAFLSWMIPKITGNKKLTGTPLRFEMLNQLESKPNLWGFKGMHDPSCEWVMNEKDRNSFWKTIEKDFVFEKAKWKLGGIRNSANLTFGIERGIDSFTFWSGPKPEFVYNSDDYDVFEDDFTSFRVVAEKGLVLDWVYFLASDVLLESNQQMTKNKIKEIYTYIESLGDNKNYLTTFESLINIHNFREDSSQIEPLKKSWNFFSNFNPDLNFPDKDFFDLLVKVGAN